MIYIWYNIPGVPEIIYIFLSFFSFKKKYINLQNSSNSKQYKTIGAESRRFLWIFGKNILTLHTTSCTHTPSIIEVWMVELGDGKRMLIDR